MQAVNSNFAAPTAVGGAKSDQSALDKTLREIEINEDEGRDQITEKSNTLRSQVSVTPSELERLYETNIACVDPDDEIESLKSDVTNLTNTGLKTLYLKERNQLHFRTKRLQRTISSSSQLAEISSVSGTQSPISEDCVENWEYFVEAANDLQNCLRDLVPGEAETELPPPEIVAGNNSPATAFSCLRDTKAVPPIPERKLVNSSKKAMDSFTLDPSGGQRWSLASSGIQDDDELSKMTVYGVPDSRVEKQLYSVDGIRRSSFETVYHPPEATEQLVLQKIPEPVPVQSICVEEVAANANEPRSWEMRQYSFMSEGKQMQATSIPTGGRRQREVQHSETNPATRSSPAQSTSLTTSISTLISSPTSNLTTDPSEKLDSKSSSPETTKTLSMKSNHDYDSDELRPSTSPPQKESCCATAPDDSVPHSFAPASSPLPLPTDAGGNGKNLKGPARHTLSSHTKPCVHARLQSPLPSSNCRQSDVSMPDSPARLSQILADTPDPADARTTQTARGEQTFNNGDYEDDQNSTQVVPEASPAVGPVWTGSKIVIKANSPVPRKPRKSGIYKRTPEGLTQAVSPPPTASTMWTEQPQRQLNCDGFRNQPSLASHYCAPCKQEANVREVAFLNGNANSPSRFPVSNFNSSEEPREEGDEDLDSEWMQKLEHIAKWQREVHQAMQNMREYDFCVSTPPPLAPIDSVVDCPADIRLDSQDIPIRLDRNDDLRRMKHPAGLQVKSYGEDRADQDPRPSNATTLGTNGASHLAPHIRTQARVSRQPPPYSEQSLTNPTSLIVRQEGDLQFNLRQVPRTSNSTITYQNGIARTSSLEPADSTAFLRRDNLPQKYTTNGGVTFVPNKSVSFTKAPDAVPFSARSTFPMPPNPVSYNLRQDRETLANHDYPEGRMSTQLTNNLAGRHPTQPGVLYKKTSTRPSLTEDSSKPIFARRNQLSSTGQF
uniref:Uncharacterized protein n=1 Tax=Schistocephalus solidus TaxID=70667 RepID=A0A0X3PQB3_SCHSO